MSKKLIVFATLVFVLLTASCSDGGLKGEVFIVTNGGDHIKLGSVEVSAIPESAMKDYLMSRKTEVEADILMAKQVWENSPFHPADKYLSGKGSGKESHGFSLNDLAKQNGLVTAKDSFSNRAVPHSEAGALLFEGMPKGVVTVTTDTEGRFNLKLSAGRYAIVAQASRQVMGTQENYYWIVWTTAEASQAVTLTNDNLLLTGEDVRILFN